MIKELARSNLKKIILIICFVQLSISSSQLESLLPKIEQIIQKATQNIWNEIEHDEPLWNMPPTLGSFFLSEYYFELKVFSLDETHPFQTAFNQQYFTAKLLAEQLPDGSWKQIHDLNRKEGLLDATIFNYWYLKEVGTDMLSHAMLNARKFILNHGGIQKSQVMTRYKLAVFGQYQWHLLNYIPLLLFKNQFPFYSYAYIKDNVAQWVYPHLTALAYFKYHKTIFPVSKVCLSELMTSRGHPPCETSTKQYLLNLFNKFNQSQPLPRDPDVDNLLEEAIRVSGDRGSFGGYTVSTLLNMMALKDYTLRYNTHQNTLATFYQLTINKSLQYVESLYFNCRTPYDGNLCDGRYWDSILSVLALLQSGQSPQKMHPYVEYLVSKVQMNGGIPYGSQFQYAPDIDDTSLLLAIYGKMRRHFNSSELSEYYSREIKRTSKWIKENQNKDGGFPAFDKDKNEEQYFWISKIFWLTKIDKSAEIFDPSCPDIVGHILEGFGQSGINDKSVLLKALVYLYKNRKDGMWSGRWGINYVYAVGAVYPGLAKVGFNMSEEWIVNITKRLVEVQQSDGGFGEDSEGYNQGKYLQGVTTASMTAWGLLAYIEASHTLNITDNILRAANYLITNFQENGCQFADRSVIAAGHRGILNLQYPVYSYTFPLLALSRLAALIKGAKNYYVDAELMEMFRRQTKTDQNQL